MRLLNAKEYLPFVQAAAEGKSIQWRPAGNNSWEDAARLDFDEGYEFRIKPTPTLRPWRPEEVPVGAQIRRTICPIDRNIISGVSALTIRLAGDCYPNKMNLCNLDEFEHSLDHGKTWLPCGIIE